MNQLDQNILELKKIEDQITELSSKKEEIRKEIFGTIENEGLTDGYKNELATVSYVERKSIKIADKEKLLEFFKKNKLVKFFDKIPKQIIPEHLELNKEFEKEVKAGLYQNELVEVETSSNLSIKFTK